MTTGNILLGGLVTGGGLATLYGLHRLALRLEERGHLYYRHKKPSGGVAGCLIALQRVVEPRAQHVMIVREEVDEGTQAAGPAGPGPLPGRGQVDHP